MTTKIDFGKLPVNTTVEGACLFSKIDREDVSNVTGKQYTVLTLNGIGNSSVNTTLFMSKGELKVTPPCVIIGKFTKKRTDKGDFVDMSKDIEICNEYSNDDFLSVAPEDVEACYEYICRIINANNYESEEITLYDLTKAVLQKYKDKLLIYPAAQRIHHPYKGGLIYHIKKMVKLAYDLASDYKVDKEVVICATILCVINKIYTLDLDENFKATVNQYYYMMNPGELSLEIVNKTVNKMEIETGKKFNFYRKQNFDICLRSYRGTRRQGASITNLTKESCLVSTIHELDVDMYVYDDKKSDLEYFAISPYDERIYTQVLNI